MKSFILLFVALSFSQFLTAADRGDVVSFEPLMKIECPTAGKTISTYAVRYMTPGVDGKLVEASGLFAYPLDNTAKLPLISYQHGTVLSPAQVPSKGYGLDKTTGCRFGTNALVSAPDYLGLGESKGFHPYLHANTEASAALDMMRASVQIAKKLNQTWNQELLLTGYSQGGHATMALLQEISRGKTEFRVKATAALSGPYDLSDVSVKAALQNPAQYNSSVYTAYLLSSFDVLYPEAKIGEMVAEKYKPYVKAFLTHDLMTIMSSTPKFPNALLAEGVIEEVLNNPKNAFVETLQKNNVYDFSPQGPVFLCYGGADNTVAPGNAAVAKKRLEELGATVSVMNAGDTLNHATAFEPCEDGAKNFFDHLN